MSPWWSLCTLNLCQVYRKRLGSLLLWAVRAQLLPIVRWCLWQYNAIKYNNNCIVLCAVQKGGVGDLYFPPTGKDTDLLGRFYESPHTHGMMLPSESPMSQRSMKPVSVSLCLSVCLSVILRFFRWLFIDFKNTYIVYLFIVLLIN